MQNFGRGMWRRVADYDRIQAPKIAKNQYLQYQQYLAIVQYQKQRQANINAYREQLLKKVNSQLDTIIESDVESKDSDVESKDSDVESKDSDVESKDTNVESNIESKDTNVEPEIEMEIEDIVIPNTQTIVAVELEISNTDETTVVEPDINVVEPDINVENIVNVVEESKKNQKKNKKKNKNISFVN
jgi:hypothetical protein